MANAKGIDISRYNISFDPSKGTTMPDFIFQKATEGTTYVDSAYELLWPGVLQVGVRGAYHYQRSGMSWKAQADHYLNVTSRHDYHMLALDLEEYGNVYGDTFFSDTKRIIDYLRTSAPTKKIVLYTNGSTYKELYYALIRLYGNSVVEWLDAVPFWLADPTIAGQPHLPLVRKPNMWDFHQYSWVGLPSTWGTGGTRVDENDFNGDTTKLRGWVGVQGEPPPPPNPPPTGGAVLEATVNTTKLRIRSGPGTNFAIIGDLWFGDKVFGAEEVTGWIHFTKVIRESSGLEEAINGWSSKEYMTNIKGLPQTTNKLQVIFNNVVEFTKEW